MSDRETDSPPAFRGRRREDRALRISRRDAATAAVIVELGEQRVELAVYRPVDDAYAVWSNAADGAVFFVELLETQ